MRDPLCAVEVSKVAGRRAPEGGLVRRMQTLLAALSLLRLADQTSLDIAGDGETFGVEHRETVRPYIKSLTFVVYVF